MSSSGRVRRGGALWRFVRRLLLSGLVLVLLLGLGPTAVVWGMSWHHTHSSVDQTPARDVTLVLGAGVLPSGEPSDFLRARLDLAADLYDAGRTKVIMVSGDNSERYYNEPEAMRRYLVERRGIPAQHVVADPGGVDTYSSCIRARRVFGITALVVVTQKYHLSRAVANCRLEGIDAEGLGDMSVSHGTAWRRGQVREFGANIKMLFDVSTRRTPVLGPPDDAVTRALAAR